MIETLHFQRAAMEFSRREEYEIHPDYVRFVRERKDRDRLVLFHQKSYKFRGLSVAGVLTKDRFVGVNHTIILENYARLLQELTPLEFIDVAEPERRLNGEMYWNLYQKDWLSEEAMVYLDLFNVRYLLEVQRPLGYPEQEIADGGQRFTKSMVGEMVVYENHLALPVVYTVHDARVADSLDETLELLKTREVDVHREAVIESPFEPAFLKPLPEESADAVRVVEYENNRVGIEAIMASAGLVVLTDPHYPGWVAKVDGEPAAVHLVNGLVRGVVVPEGEHTVEFVFRPRSFYIGLMITVICFLFMGILLAVEVTRTNSG
jgi:hypothetical protein